MRVPDSGHESVLTDEVVRLLSPKPGGIIVDCTIGRGGHALAICRQLGPGGLLIGIDFDPRNLEFARQRLISACCATRFFHANFAQLRDLLAGQMGIAAVDGILADLGPSTNQLLDPAYGLSFTHNANLDMRLDPRIEQNAADYVNRLSKRELADVLYQLAQERYARRIAGKIVEARRLSPITSTERLAEIVRAAAPPRHAACGRIDPASRTFLALRMLVNREVESLRSLLETGPELLRPGGRMAVIAFHSTEDRLVKRAFRARQASGEFQILTPKPVRPGPEEIARNPRSRSAKLRVLSRIPLPGATGLEKP